MKQVSTVLIQLSLPSNNSPPKNYELILATLPAFKLFHNGADPLYHLLLYRLLYRRRMFSNTSARPHKILYQIRDRAGQGHTLWQRAPTIDKVVPRVRIWQIWVA